MSTLDFESFMNGHMDQPAPSKVQTAEPSAGIIGNPYLTDPHLGLELCSSLIAKVEKYGEVSQVLEEIKLLVEYEFLQHTETDDNTIGAKAYLKLMQWQDLLTEAVSFPQLQQSYTVAVGGSFSAGKTRFLNTVLGCPSLLPVDTTPTTSIPTFLFKGQKDSIDALNFYGKKTQIDEEALKAICHAFNEKYQVTFSHILQLITVERAEFKYSNLIFLDTPGYSKSDNVISSEQNTDENIARVHLRTADYLIWLVDHQNGTVPQPDIEFLQSLDLQQPVLVVMSKTDKKPATEICKIIDVARKDLESADIDYLDVIGYSAQDDSEISDVGDRLTSFLAEVNQGSQGSTLQWQLKKIFADYSNHYNSGQQMLKLTYGTINELIFDEKISEDKKKHLTDIHKKTKAQLDALYKQKKEAEAIHSKIDDLLLKVCELLNIRLSDRPTAIQVNSIRKKTEVVQQQDALTFDALMQGDLSQLANLANLNELKGEIIKISPIGLSIKLDVAPTLEIMVLQITVSKIAPGVKYSKFYIGQEVKVQIINDKKASVSLTIDIKKRE